MRGMPSVTVSWQCLQQQLITPDQESIVKGKLVMNDDGFIEYQETPKYNAMLRGGQTAEVEEWIIQACEVRTQMMQAFS